MLGKIILTQRQVLKGNQPNFVFQIFFTFHMFYSESINETEEKIFFLQRTHGNSLQKIVS